MRLARIAVAISGGVDSAVSAYLLKRQGYDIIGVFMTNWDSLDENFECHIHQDHVDAQYVCEKLGIDLIHKNFVRHYWNHVFEAVISDYKRGWTPNPDILCNKYIKFNHLAQSVFNELGADFLATGHYAQTHPNHLMPTMNSGDSVTQLLRSVDPVKDQTYWLAQISGQILRRVVFPIGHLLKPQVKLIAEDAGLHRTLRRKESMGMCFVGKRKFFDFIEQYIAPSPGLYKDLETGVILGEHTGIHHFTLGQRAPVAKNDHPQYVAALDPITQEIKLVERPDHPALFMQQSVIAQPHWINDSVDNPFLDRNTSKNEVIVDFQWQNKFRPIPCRIIFTESNEYKVYLSHPMRCIVPGQFAVFYRGERCLGSAQIIEAPSLWQSSSPPCSVKWDSRNFERFYSSECTNSLELSQNSG